MAEKQPQNAAEKRLLFCAALLCGLTLTAAIASIVLAGTNLRTHPAAISLYALACTLSFATAILLFCCRKKLKAAFAAWLSDSALLQAARRHRRLAATLSDPLYRGKLITTLSLLGNAGYLAYLVGMAAVFRSEWYGALVGYYAAIWLIRGVIFLLARRFEKRTTAPAALARKNTLLFLACGCTLPVLGGVMVAPIIQMAIGAYPSGGGVLNVIVNAVYALAKLLSALIQLARARILPHPAVRALRILGLISAMMSLLSLEVAIIIAFAHGYTMWQWVAGFGGIVSSITTLTGIYMIARGAAELKKQTYFTPKEADGYGGSGE